MRKRRPREVRDLPHVTQQEWVQGVSALNSPCLSWGIGTCSGQGLVLGGCREQSGPWASIPVRQLWGGVPVYVVLLTTGRGGRNAFLEEEAARDLTLEKQA